jgi:excinuclease UvrABC ATPase subunit
VATLTKIHDYLRLLYAASPGALPAVRPASAKQSAEQIVDRR